MSKLTNWPFMSVVVISHNGAETIGRTIQSLINQDYPKNRYEIIVIDDGSKDQTAQIARSYKDVRVKSFTSNRGISAARNAGLKLMVGDIYVSFDDDCIAQKNWLRQLATGYRFRQPIGIGGQLCQSGAIDGLINRYVNICDHNFDSRLIGSRSERRDWLIRLLDYWMSHFKPNNLPAKRLMPVNELYGANGSYPIDVLRRVGGWREDMSGIEDRDLSFRIRLAFPERQFYVNSSAKIEHKRDQSLISYLSRPYRRGKVNLAFHRQHQIIPPIFPFPLIFIFTLIIFLIYLPLAIPLIVIFLPQILYCWWIVIAKQRHSLIPLIFVYLQLGEELMVILGLARGFLVVLNRRLSHAT